MSPEQTDKSKDTPKRNRFSFSNLRKLPLELLVSGVLIFVLIILGITAVLIKHNNDTNQKAASLKTVAEFSKTNKLSLAGSAPDAGVTLNLPTEFSQKPTSAKIGASFSQNSSGNNGLLVPVAELSLKSKTSSAAYQQSYLDYLGKSILAATNKNPQSIQPLLDYASQALDTNYQINFVSVKVFTNPNIKKNAWQINVTATSTDKKDTDHKNQKGRVVFMVSAKNTYYFAALATDSKWDNNQGSWQKVFDSIKIDQIIPG